MSRRPHHQSMMSPVDAIDQLTFCELPKDRAVDVVKIARHGNTTLYQDAKGLIYSAGVSFTGCFIVGRGRMDDYLRCAVKLGAITNADLRKHFKAADEREARQKIVRAKEELVKLAAKAGIKLTKSQLAQLAQKHAKQ